jgi:hypothetical protein
MTHTISQRGFRHNKFYLIYIDLDINEDLGTKTLILRLSQIFKFKTVDTIKGIYCRHFFIANNIYKI